MKIEEKIYKICRVLIGVKNDRGKGYGKLLVQKMIEIAKSKLEATKLRLAVIEKNTSALNCYLSLGFSIY